MSIPAPHFVLISDCQRKKHPGHWSFALQTSDGARSLEAADADPEARGERLELLAVVRGLEALDQPSRVTLVTSSRYVKSGICYGLQEWGRNGWTWEHFGEMVPVKNRDLWQRLDRALRIHRIEGPIYRRDQAHVARIDESDTLTEACSPVAQNSQPAKPRTRRPRRSWRRSLADRVEGCWLTIRQLGTSLLPYPWLD